MMELTDLELEPQGMRKHFWTESIFRDRQGRERWQTKERIEEKLWALTSVEGLWTLESFFQGENWYETIRKACKLTWLDPVLHSLLKAPESRQAVKPLAQFIPESFSEDDEPLVELFDERPQ
ncbi:MAG: hypothetical protein ACRC61_06120, partial [Aeromonas salmonicida]